MATDDADRDPLPFGSTSDVFAWLVEGITEHAIFLLDRGGRVISWNAGAERIKGWAKHEILGEHFSRFYLDDDVRSGRPAAELRRAEREGRAEDEGHRVRKDGTRFWAGVAISALRDERGRVLAYAKVTRDLTARRDAEEQRVSRARLDEAARLRDAVQAELEASAPELRTALAALSEELGGRAAGHVARVERAVEHVLRALHQVAKTGPSGRSAP